MSNSTFILIPVYNRRKVTLNCLRNLYEDISIQSWNDLKIVVIDDGSTDGTAAAIEQQFPTVEVLKGDGNLWWTGAIHKGMTYAFNQGGQTIFWLNDDCIPLPSSLKRMHKSSLEQGKAIIGAACYLAETGILQPTGAQGRKRKSASPGELIPVDEMSGHCVCIPRIVIQTIGFPDTKHFPHYHGDSGYILRATHAGFRAYILGDAKVTHLEQIKSRLDNFSDFKKSGFISSFEAIFLSQKSLYFLPTQYHYNVNKYGLFPGASLFALKLGWWLSQWIWLNLANLIG